MKKKYHLVKWEIICKAKKKGGRGLKDLRKLNISLLCKWWWHLENSEGIQHDLVSLKYVKKHPICLIPSRMDDSPLWKDMMKVRHIYLKGREYQIHNGKSVSFWLDKWVGEKPLCLEYPILNDACTHKDSSVHDVAETGCVVRLKFRLQGALREQWYNLAAMLNMVPLDNEKDKAI
jgi:hypothetical protein